MMIRYVAISNLRKHMINLGWFYLAKPHAGRECPWASCCDICITVKTACGTTYVQKTKCLLIPVRMKQLVRPQCLVLCPLVMKKRFQVHLDSQRNNH